MAQSDGIIDVLEQFSEFSRVSMVFEHGKINSIIIESVNPDKDEETLAEELKRELSDLNAKLKIQDTTSDIVKKIIDKVFTKHV